MSDANHLKELLEAFNLSPDNAVLWRLIIGSYEESESYLDAAGFLSGISRKDQFNDEDLGRAGYLLLRAGEPGRALEWVGDQQQGKAALVRVRALVDLDRREEAEEVYSRAIHHNAALEDPSLAALIRSKVTSIEGKGRTPLRLVTNKSPSDDLSRLLSPPAETLDFSDVGGLESVKKQVRRKIILPFQKPGLFRRFRKRVGGGILMYGPPGCGKTLLARATAGECEATFFNVAISDVLDMWIGESEQKLHSLFEQARESIPSVLFFDELEALGGKRHHARESTTAKLISQFLAEMDGFSQANSGVLVLAATNLPWAIDPAFRRPGRFDRILFVPPPDKEARQTILSIHLEGRPGAETIDLPPLIRKTSGFSGADLSNLVETAVEEAIEESLDRGEEVPLRQEHFMSALKDIRPTTSEWLTTARNYARYANEGGQYDEVLDFLAKYSRS